METPQNELIQLGNAIASLRSAKNMGVDELSARSGLDVEFINEVEAGQKEPTILDIAAISKALGSTMKELLESAGL